MSQNGIHADAVQDNKNQTIQHIHHVSKRKPFAHPGTDSFPQNLLLNLAFCLFHYIRVTCPKHHPTLYFLS